MTTEESEQLQAGIELGERWGRDLDAALQAIGAEMAALKPVSGDRTAVHRGAIALLDRALVTVDEFEQAAQVLAAGQLPGDTLDFLDGLRREFLDRQRTVREGLAIVESWGN